MTTEAKVGVRRPQARQSLQPQEAGGGSVLEHLEGMQPCPHLDFQLLDLGATRGSISVLSHPVGGHLLRQPSEPNTGRTAPAPPSACSVPGSCVTQQWRSTRWDPGSNDTSGAHTMPGCGQAGFARSPRSSSKTLPGAESPVPVDFHFAPEPQL